MQILIGIDQPDAWRRALHGLPHGYWHTWEACHAIALGTGLPIFLYSSEDTATGARAACPFAERHWGESVDIFTPVGFSGFVGVGDAAMLRRQWLDFVAARGYVCGYFALHPMLANAALHSGLGATNTLYVLDLSGGAVAALERVDRDVRRVLRNWTRSGATLVIDRGELTQFLLENYAAFMASVGTNPAAIWFDASLRSMCEDEALLMVGAADAEGVCAAYTFGTTAFGADAHLNISIREGRRFITPMVGWGIETLAARRLPWLNLGGGLIPTDAVARAKHKFGPERAPLRVAREIYRADTYRQLCTEAGRDPDHPGGFFPGYRRRPSPAHEA